MSRAAKMRGSIAPKLGRPSHDGTWARPDIAIARLLAEGLTRVVLVEWKSATPEMRFLRSDD
jgi:hypothetical protein